MYDTIIPSFAKKSNSKTSVFLSFMCKMEKTLVICVFLLYNYYYIIGTIISIKFNGGAIWALKLSKAVFIQAI